MIVSISEQGYLFLISVALGIGISLFFDFFRVLRKIKKYKNKDVYIQDTIFIITITIFSFYTYLYKSNGAIRFYYFTGMILGNVFYYSIFSNIIRSIMSKCIIFLEKVVMKFIYILLLPVKYIYKKIKPYGVLYTGKTKRKLSKGRAIFSKPRWYLKNKFRNIKRKMKIIFEKV